MGQRLGAGALVLVVAAALIALGVWLLTLGGWWVWLSLLVFGAALNRLFLAAVIFLDLKL